MNWRHLLWPSNLLSLGRIVLALPLGYCLAQQTTGATIAAVFILALAGVTDFLDGDIARKSGQVSMLGAALDPVADKVFAALFMVFLIFYRDFPVWLAAVLIGRDLLLLFGGIALLSRGRVTIPARLYGKYLFFATVFLLGSYLIEYRFGELLSGVCVLALCLVSLIDYFFVFLKVYSGEPLPPYDEKRGAQKLRVGAAALILVVYIAGWFAEKIG
jgi:CDP-diacylglycerol--glycerol-3-phosphate 3-phosphatidyltransferase